MPPLPNRSDPKGRENRTLAEVISRQQDEVARQRRKRFPNKDRNLSDWEYWLNTALSLQRWAAVAGESGPDYETVTIAVRFVSALVQVSQLLHHFNALDSDRKAVDTVAERLGVSRTAVFDWLNALQLKSEDFLARKSEDFNDALSHLVAKSRVGDLLVAVMEKAAESPGARRPK
jgi:hypothetical protein